MNVLDRYLRSVRQFLPRAQRDDVLRELEENLRSEMEERETELGRPLNEADRKAILLRHGSPMSFAARYRQNERRLAIGIELIGPALFPHFLKWLAIPIGITVLLFVAAILAGARPTLGQFLLPIGIQFACVTSIFIVLQACRIEPDPFGRLKRPSPTGAELVRRYLHEVRFWLPKEQRDDIVAELDEDLRSEIEEREAALGRSLDEAELVAILKAHGEPVTMASKYLPPRYLIGPALFPIYRFVVKLVVLGILVPVFVLIVGPIAVKTAVNPSLAGVQALWNLLMSAVFSLGVITLVFAIMELRFRHAPHDWDPRELPPVPAPSFPSDAEPMTRYRAFANIALSALTALAWVYLARAGTAGHFEGLNIGLSGVWHTLFWPILAVFLSGVFVGLAGLIRPEAVRMHASIRLASNALSLVLIGFLLKGQSWIEISSAGRPLDGIEDAVKWSNLGIWISLLIVGAIVLAQTVHEARLILRRKDGAFRHLAAAVFLLFVCSPARAQSPFPPDEHVRAILADRVDIQRTSLGTVVGLVSPQGRRIFAYGRAGQGDLPKLDGDTVFEIGSVTKIFTALLLSDMVQRGEVALQDPVSLYLPAGTRLPSRSGREIQLVDLATHTSGLPFAPTDLNVMDPSEWARYSENRLYQFLSTYQIKEDIGTKWAYSNLGAGLLGLALSRRAGMSYEDLVCKRITTPLGMKSTAITLTPGMKERLAAGHDASLRVAPAWEAPAMQGAGALRSTANDLLSLLAAFLGEGKSPLARSMGTMFDTRRPAPSFEQALGWWVVKLGADQDPFVAMGGQTAGFACTLAYDPKLRAGVVVLSNVAKDDGGLGWHLLRPAFPVATSAALKQQQQRKEIAVDPKVLDGLVGRYSPPAPSESIRVERSEDALMVRFPTSPVPSRLHAENDRSFYITETDLQVTFQVDEQGRASAMVVRFAGSETVATRRQD